MREIESWLLADVEGVSALLGVSRSLFDTNPETLPDPKQALVNLARHSRRRAIRSAIVPEEALPPRQALATAQQWWGKPIPPELADVFNALACELWRKRTGWLAGLADHGGLELAATNGEFHELLEQMVPDQGDDPVRRTAARLRLALEQRSDDLSDHWKAREIALDTWNAMSERQRCRVDYVLFRFSRATSAAGKRAPPELLKAHLVYRVVADQLDRPTSWYAR